MLDLASKSISSSLQYSQNAIFERERDADDFEKCNQTQNRRRNKGNPLPRARGSDGNERVVIVSRAIFGLVKVFDLRGMMIELRKSSLVREQSDETRRKQHGCKQ